MIRLAKATTNGLLVVITHCNGKKDTHTRNDFLKKMENYSIPMKHALCFSRDDDGRAQVLKWIMEDDYIIINNLRSFCFRHYIYIYLCVSITYQCIIIYDRDFTINCQL